MPLQYTLFYDIRQAGPPGGLALAALAFILGAVTAALLWSALRRRGRRRSLRRRDTPATQSLGTNLGQLLIFGAVGALFALVTAQATGVFAHNRCSGWMESGDVQMIQGPVSEFVAAEKSGGEERFSVSGVRFIFSGNDPSRCGFKQTSADGGPLREGLQVRIAYRDGAILRLEIAP